MQIERSWGLGTELVKWNITAANENSHCLIIEVTCPYKTSVEYLWQRKIEKERK